MKIKGLFLFGFLCFLLISPFQVNAKSPDKTIHWVSNGTNDKMIFTLDQVGYRQRDLVSPLDATNVLFNIPPNWHLLAGGEFEIHYNVVLSGADANKIVDNKNPYGGNLTLSLNNIIIGIVPLDEVGSHTTRVKIPTAAFVSKEKDGSQILTISLNAQFSCLYNLRAIVTVDPSSFFDLPYETSTLDLNLSRLPAPFYLRNSFVPESVLVVVPDNPNILDLQAALDIMAGFGSTVGGIYDIQLVNVRQLARMNRALYHMIFVGKPDNLGDLSNIDFQIPIVNGAFVNIPPESTTDGIIQLAHSPWNPDKAIMLVSGISGDAIVKAAQAVSSQNVIVYKNPAVVYVSNVQLLTETGSVVDDFSFKDLGYETKTLSGVGIFSTEYTFHVSKEQAATPDGYIDLVYYHSGLLDAGSASMSVDLNKQVINSVAFSKETDQVTTLRIKFPPDTLRIGENTLRVTASMPQLTQTTNQACDHSGLSNPWITVSDQTRVHISATTVHAPTKPLLNNLKLFSQSLTAQDDLGTIAFVLSKSNPVSWSVAGQLAYDLGDTTNSIIPDLTAVYADNADQNILNTKSLVVVGLASELPLLTQFNDLLPAPFDFKKNIANERNMQISYRIPADVGVGYLELMASPYNPEKAILVVSGNNSNGLVFAGNGLTLTDLQSQLAGVFAITNGTQVATGSISASVPIATIIPGSTPIVATPIPDFVSQTPSDVRPTWPIPVIAVTSIIILLIIGVVVKKAIAQNRASHTQIPDQDRQNIDKTDENPS